MPLLYRVNSAQLNLRSAPKVKPNTRLAVLSQGDLVEKLADADVAGWWQVRANISGLTVEGFINCHFLEPATVPPPTGSTRVEAVHLQTTDPVRRNMTSGRARPLNEPAQPTRDAGGADDLAKIIAWLRVEHSARYEPTSGRTYCNIYAYDYCYLARVYLPRVWWRDSALVKLSQGQEVPVLYDTTVQELNANALCNWFDEFSRRFGWRSTVDLNELQGAANAGAVGIIVARRVDLNYSGHIVGVVPETPSKRAQRSDGTVTVPLQSQAGSSNFRYGTGSRWWTQSKFNKYGFWIHE